MIIVRNGEEHFSVKDVCQKEPTKQTRNNTCLWTPIPRYNDQSVSLAVDFCFRFRLRSWPAGRPAVAAGQVAGRRGPRSIPVS